MGLSNSEEKLEQTGWESDDSVTYVPQRRRLAQPTCDNGDWSAFFTQMADMTSHVLIAQPGQDIATTLLLLTAQYSPRGVCIMSGIGEISSVELGNLDPAVGSTTKLEGRFDIIKLSGNLIPCYGQGTTGGGIDIVLVDQADSERRAISGPVRGCLRAATPVQIVLGIFLPGQSPVIPTGAPMREPEAVAPAADAAPAEEEAGLAGNGHQSSTRRGEGNPQEADATSAAPAADTGSAAAH